MHDRSDAATENRRDTHEHPAAALHLLKGFLQFPHVVPQLGQVFFDRSHICFEASELALDRVCHFTTPLIFSTVRYAPRPSIGTRMDITISVLMPGREMVFPKSAITH